MFKIGDKVRIISKAVPKYYLEEGTILDRDVALYSFHEHPDGQRRGEMICALDIFPTPPPPAKYYWIPERLLQPVGDHDQPGSMEDLKEIWTPKKTTVGSA